MATKKKSHGGSKKRKPLWLLEKWAGKIVKTVHSRGGKVPGVDAGRRRKTRHKKSR
jgi:hypothetical protein